VLSPKFVRLNRFERLTGTMIIIRANNCLTMITLRKRRVYDPATGLGIVDRSQHSAIAHMGGESSANCDILLESWPTAFGSRISHKERRRRVKMLKGSYSHGATH
jgi:hypothetical protein